MKNFLRVLALAFAFAELSAQTIPRYHVVLSDSQASVGYYFLHAVKVGAPSTPSHIILDAQGRLVYFKPFTRASSDFKLHPNGMMSYLGTTGVPSNLKFFLMDSTFVVVDSVQCRNGIFTDAHDLQILPNGHYLVLGYEFRTVNLSSYLWFNGNGSPGSATASVKCGVIQELDENKNVVFEWKGYNHFQFADVQEERLFDPVNVDWTHVNSIGVDDDGNLLLSSRWFSEVTKINRQTGAIIWRLGGKRNQFSFLNDPFNGTYGQHDARRIANGRLTIFDNGRAGNPIHPARAVEYALDEQNRTAALVWSYAYNSSSISTALGNVQRLSDGNSVIGWGTIRNANVVFNSVKADGSPILLLRFPDTLVTYRAFNYPTLPWRLNRPVITCSTSGGNFILDAGAGYNSYLWSTGATTRTIQVSAPDTYVVFVPYGNGGYISSPKVVITSMTNPCAQVTEVNNDVKDVPREFVLKQNYPNPFNPSTKISFTLAHPSFVRLKLFDLLGREAAVLVNGELDSGEHHIDVDGVGLASGVYFYRLEADKFIETKKFVLSR